MKKFLMVAALVAMVAAPAFAGLAPLQHSNNSLSAQEYSVAVDGSATGRAAAYAPNDAGHVYDNYQSAPLLGPDDVIASFPNIGSTGVNSGGMYNQMTLKGGSTDITFMHLRIVTGWQACNGGFTTLPLQFAMYSSAGGTNPIGSFLTYGGGLSAFFSVNVPNTSGPLLYNFNVALPVINAPANGKMWIGFASSCKFSIRAGVENGTQFDGGAGDAFPASKYIGSGSGRFGGFSGGGLGSASAVSNTGFTAFTTSTPYTYINNWHVALGGHGVPEPMTAGLLGLGGLLMLRRRKA